MRVNKAAKKKTARKISKSEEKRRHEVEQAWREGPTTSSSGSAKLSEDDTMEEISRIKKEPELVKWFIETTTLHGISYVYFAATQALRLFWISVCCAMVGVIGFEVYAVINDYVMHPYTTSIGQRQLNYLEIPDFVICTKHRVTHDFTKRHNLSQRLVEYMHSVFSERSLFELKLSNEELETLENLYAKFRSDAGYANMEHILRESAISCKPVFPLCIHSGSKLDDCCEHIKPFMMAEGPCFALKFVNVSEHHPGPIRQFHGGPAHGINVAVDLQPSQHPQTLYNTDIGFGLSVHIGHPHLSYAPLPWDNHKITIPPGTAAHIKLQKLSRSIATNCVKHGSNMKLRYFDGYVTQACLYECMLNVARRECGCVPLGHNVSRYFSRFEDKAKEDRYCEPYESLSCVRPLMYNVNTHTFKSIWEHISFQKNLSACYEGCKLRCTSTEYKAEVSYLAFPSPAAMPQLASDYNLTEEDTTHTSSQNNPYFSLERRFVVANVYFADIEVTESKQVSTATINGLVSNIGGQLSLFSGCSAITVIHGIMFVFAYCRRKLQTEVKTNDG